MILMPTKVGSYYKIKYGDYLYYFTEAAIKEIQGKELDDIPSQLIASSTYIVDTKTNRLVKYVIGIETILEKFLLPAPVQTPIHIPSHLPKLFDRPKVEGFVEQYPSARN